MESSQSVRYYRLLHRPTTSMLLGKKIPLAYLPGVYWMPSSVKGSAGYGKKILEPMEPTVVTITA
jgi:hypothetical protein